MVKTTITLDTEVYKALVEEAIMRYGTTKNLSRLINEKLKVSTVRKRRDIVKLTSGLWKLDISGKEYTRKLRSEWEHRTKGWVNE